ncbi:MAG: hypothetical protein R2864_03555 [Syntrophotaleaceae bacterium]
MLWDGATTSQDIELTLDTTQYANDSQVLSQEQDGYGPSNLMKISIDGDGTVTANYSDRGGSRNIALYWPSLPTLAA